MVGRDECRQQFGHHGESGPLVVGQHCELAIQARHGLAANSHGQRGMRGSGFGDGGQHVHVGLHLQLVGAHGLMGFHGVQHGNALCQQFAFHAEFHLGPCAVVVVLHNTLEAGFHAVDHHRVVQFVEIFQTQRTIVFPFNLLFLLHLLF